ncbi:MAG: hypothetical protein LKH93_06970 [Clostridium beijerinckii]|jgi:carbamoylphosphate synthase large subunit|nr:hypothetical protein [Clostridium beijerinckii]MCI1578568.1 hypothetical protein [Clostridium beijerinckii]MCI1582100.1 hypothetical protein [Clostridium beijerinckii]MCI1621950.1 hypothetical protein [Clostridium beijerinckii]
MLVDTIIISNTFDGYGEKIINTLSEQGYEIDIVQKNIAGLPPEQILNIYRVRP